VGVAAAKAARARGGERGPVTGDSRDQRQRLREPERERVGGAGLL